MSLVEFVEVEESDVEREDAQGGGRVAVGELVGGERMEREVVHDIAGEQDQTEKGEYEVPSSPNDPKQHEEDVDDHEERESESEESGKNKLLGRDLSGESRQEQEDDEDDVQREIEGM